MLEMVASARASYPSDTSDTRKAWIGQARENTYHVYFSVIEKWEKELSKDDRETSRAKAGRSKVST
jgi:hypothetical protein